MKDIAQTLIERRANLVHEMRALLDERGDQNGVLPAEVEEQYQKMNEQVSALGARVEELLEIHEANKKAEEYKEDYERFVAPEVRDAAKKKEDNALRSFMNAARRGEKPTLELVGFNKISRHIDPQSGRFDIKAALGEDVAGEGGNTVPTDFLNTLYQHLIHASAIRRTNVRILPTSNGRSIQIPKTASYGTAVWVGEGTAIGGSDASFGQLTLDAWKVAQLVRVSNELLEDTGVDLTGFLAEDLGRAIGEAEGARFVSGSGTNTPRGVITAIKADVGTAVQVASASVEFDNLIDLYYDILPPYRQNAFWFMSDDLEKDLRKVKNGNDEYVWQMSIQAGAPDVLLGKPVIIDPNMQSVGSANVPVAFGDFSRGFIIREDGNPEVAVSSERYFDTDEQAWRITHRVDSDMLDTRALDILDTD